MNASVSKLQLSRVPLSWRQPCVTAAPKVNSVRISAPASFNTWEISHSYVSYCPSLCLPTDEVLFGRCRGLEYNFEVVNWHFDVQELISTTKETLISTLVPLHIEQDTPDKQLTAGCSGGAVNGSAPYCNTRALHCLALQLLWSLVRPLLRTAALLLGRTRSGLSEHAVLTLWENVDFGGRQIFSRCSTHPHWGKRSKWLNTPAWVTILLQELLHV